MFDLSGKTAIVTGASRGLGRAIAVALAGRGAMEGLHALGAGAQGLALGVDQVASSNGAAGSRRRALASSASKIACGATRSSARDALVAASEAAVASPAATASRT